MATTHPNTLRGKNLPEAIIPNNNFQPKLKVQAGFVRKSALLFLILYTYHDEVKRDDLME